MNLDLQAFKKNSESLKMSRQGGKFSAIYQELDKGFDEIMAVKEKGATQVQLLDLLKKSGMPTIEKHNLNGWWNSAPTKARREDYEKGKELAKKQQAKREADARAQEDNVLKGKERAKKVPIAVATHLVKEKTEKKPAVVGADLGTRMTWAEFTAHCKTTFDADLTEIREAMVGRGMIGTDSTIFVRSNPYFPDVEDWSKRIVWKDMIVLSDLSNLLFS